MTSATPRSLFKHALLFLITLFAFAVLAPQQVKAYKQPIPFLQTMWSLPISQHRQIVLLAAKKKGDSVAKVADSVAKSSHLNQPLLAVKRLKPLAIIYRRAFGWFYSVLLPCIYPMLPLTVSFFTKKGGSKAKGIMAIIIYGYLS
jgi:thiol:disulfide interchange protein